MRRVRAVIGDRIPLVASLDYHTNLTAEMVRHASAMVGYRTYPHIDMAETGSRAAWLLDRLLRDHRPLYKAYRQLDFLIPLVWQCSLMEPAKGIFELIAEIERGSDKSGGPSGSHNQGTSPTRRDSHRPTSPNAARRWWSTDMTRRQPKPLRIASPMSSRRKSRLCRQALHSG
jgi:metallopeptidase family M81